MLSQGKKYLLNLLNLVHLNFGESAVKPHVCQNLKCKVQIPQFGNFMIFLSLRFYVKSIYGTLEVQNLPFLHI